MYEVEVKVPADHDGVRKRLSELNAVALGRVRQVDTYYDAPHRDFAETDEALRLRREARKSGVHVESGGEGEAEGVADEGGAVLRAHDERDGFGGDERTRVTYKGPLVEAESKTREEFETAVAEGETMDAILGGLGFEPRATVEKERERFELREYTVTLDSVSDLGTFVEVEREAAEADIESAREGAYAVLRDLGLDPDDQIRTSYLGLALKNE
jgi:adenylate cyclase class 2